MEKTILIVDDEKNIRLTISHSLKAEGMKINSAMNGEEALKMLKEDYYNLVFLDLRMPGMDGIKVLELIKNDHPKTNVIIITAYGSIESAVEAMKLGAVDFIQKPFNPDEIREIASKVLARDELSEESEDYGVLIELTKRNITKRDLNAAFKQIKKAISVNPGQPEAYNLLGALHEIKGDLQEARKFYRAALSINPAYKPASDNLNRVTRF